MATDLSTDAAVVTRRQPDRWLIAALAALAYLPMVLSRPGMISADTKVYLTLDPGALLGRAWSIWDPLVGAGTVTHQNIGYLFPLGPLYWLADAAAIPDWLVQRLLWASIVFASATGTYRLGRYLGYGAAAAFVMALAYGFSPYLLSYLARLSVILLPWAALPWLILLASAAVRSSSWRAPARFALVVAVIGSVNATSLLLVGLGPVIWVLVEFIGGRHRLRPVVTGAARTLVLTAGVSAWWVLALRIQGNYGLPILRFTETYQTVAEASTPPEIMRGLGYWLAYGGDRLSPWVEATEVYTEPWMIALGSILVGLALIGLTLTVSGRRRAIALLVVGLTIAVGAAPLEGSSLYGRLFERFATDTTAGLALRSTPRAAPLVILALAIGLAAITGRISAVLSRSQRPRLAPLAPVVISAALLVQLMPWFSGTALTESILRPSQLPADQTDLAAWLERPTAPSGRVWELPGADFAAHRWGGTIDPILPGLIGRPTLQRALVPQGGEATVDLLGAFDRRLHEGVAEPDTIDAFARLFGIETIVVRNDLEHERFRLVRPNHLWPYLLESLGTPDHLGPEISDAPQIPMLDEIALATPRQSDLFASVAGWDLDTDTGLIEVSARSPMIVAGDAEGLVDLAAAGLLDPTRPILYAGTADRHRELSTTGIGPPRLVATDTNRRQGRRWSTLGVNHGALEVAGETPLRSDPSDQRLVLDSAETDAERTVLVPSSPVVLVRATSYGNRIAYTPEDAARFAFDGDPRTAWRTAVFGSIEGEYLELIFDTELAADEITIVQPTTLVTSRYLTKVKLVFDDDVEIEVALDESSRTIDGQRIGFEPQVFSTLRVELLADNLGPQSSYAGQPGVGIAEIIIDGVNPESTTLMPTAWLNEIDGVADADLDIVMNRSRLDPATLNRADPEPWLDRTFSIPVPRAFELTGTARLNTVVDDLALARALGAPETAWASTRLLGSVAAWAPSAIDGSSQSAWTTDFDASLGARWSLQLDTAEPVDRIVIDAIHDERHSLPQSYLVHLRSDVGETRTIAATTGPEPQRSVIDLDGTALSAVDIEITAVDGRLTPEYFSGAPRELPVALNVELSYDGDALAVPVPDAIDARCRDDLIAINGEPHPVALVGEVADALRRDAIEIVSCAPLIDLGAGEHRVTTSDGFNTGLNIDRLVLSSPSTVEFVAPTTISDPISYERLGPTALRAEIPPSDTPLWLTLRESWNPGWELRIDSGPSAGEVLEPVLVDGYATGWVLPPAAQSVAVSIDWAPQRQIIIGIAVSALALIAAIALAIGRRRQPEASASTPARLTRTEPVLTRDRWWTDWIDVVVWTPVLFVVGGIAAAGSYLLIRLVWQAPTSRLSHAVPALVATTAWTISALYITALQFGYGYVADPQWPSRFSVVSPLTWVAVGAVVGAAPWIATRSSADHHHGATRR